MIKIELNYKKGATIDPVTTGQAAFWAKRLGDTAFENREIHTATPHYEKYLNYDLEAMAGWFNLAEIQLQTMAFPEASIVYVIEPAR